MGMAIQKLCSKKLLNALLCLSLEKNKVILLQDFQEFLKVFYCADLVISYLLYINLNK